MAVNNLIELARRVKEMRLWQERYRHDESSEALRKVRGCEIDIDVEVAWILRDAVALNDELKKWNDGVRADG